MQAGADVDARDLGLGKGARDGHEAVADGAAHLEDLLWLQVGEHLEQMRDDGLAAHVVHLAALATAAVERGGLVEHGALADALQVAGQVEVITARHHVRVGGGADLVGDAWRQRTHGRVHLGVHAGLQRDHELLFGELAVVADGHHGVGAGCWHEGFLRGPWWSPIRSHFKIHPRRPGPVPHGGNYPATSRRRVFCTREHTDWRP